MIRILAVDFGEKRVGLALSDPLGYTAQGLKTLIRDSDNSVIVAIKGICDEKGVTECIVGLPLRMSGEEGDRAKRVRSWIEKLKLQISCPIRTWDERLSTRQAERFLIEQNVSRKKRKEVNDQLAAILILQNYLDFRMNDIADTTQ